MKNKLRKTTVREKHQIDATDQIAGRLASRTAFLLIGKHKVTYRPNIDAGDFVEIINIKKIKFTGKKLTQKMYYHPTGYLGGLKQVSLTKLLQEKPATMFKIMVSRMLPKNKLRNDRLKRLTIKK